jgi:ABC-type multidrug transport system fused ATPase/permease subunit
MDGGKIIAFGKHEYLLENNEIYQDLYVSQNKHNDAKEVE